MLTAILAIAFLAVLFGLLLGYSAIRFKVEGDPLAERIDALLPQTQCGQCGYPGCKPYAEAIAKGEAPINKCVPGGTTTVIALADLLGRDPEPLSDAGPEKPKAVAVIDEQECIALVVRRGGRQLRFGPELEPEALCSCGRGQGGGRDEQPADRAGHRKGGIERRIARMPEVYGLTW